MSRAPHYLRFVRALALVSAALPVPLVVVAGCSAGTPGTGTTTQGPPPGSSACNGCGIQPGPATGSQPAPGVSPAPDSGADATADANNDGGGGPARGTPEMPRANGARFA